jgi:hypothetical protein
VATQEKLKIDENTNATLKRLEEVYAHSEKAAFAFSLMAILLITLFFALIIFCDIFTIFISKSTKSEKEKTFKLNNNRPITPEYIN